MNICIILIALLAAASSVQAEEADVKSAIYDRVAFVDSKVLNLRQDKRQATHVVAHGNAASVLLKPYCSDGPGNASFLKCVRGIIAVKQNSGGVYFGKSFYGAVLKAFSWNEPVDCSVLIEYAKKDVKDIELHHGYRVSATTETCESLADLIVQGFGVRPRWVGCQGENFSTDMFVSCMQTYFGIVEEETALKAWFDFFKPTNETKYGFFGFPSERGWAFQGRLEKIEDQKQWLKRTVQQCVSKGDANSAGEASAGNQAYAQLADTGYADINFSRLNGFAKQPTCAHWIAFGKAVGFVRQEEVASAQSAATVKQCWRRVEPGSNPPRILTNQVVFSTMTVEEANEAFNSALLKNCNNLSAAFRATDSGQSPLPLAFGQLEPVDGSCTVITPGMQIRIRPQVTAVVSCISETPQTQKCVVDSQIELQCGGNALMQAMCNTISSIPAQFEIKARYEVAACTWNGLDYRGLK